MYDSLVRCEGSGIRNESKSILERVAMHEAQNIQRTHGQRQRKKFNQ